MSSVKALRSQCCWCALAGCVQPGTSSARVACVTCRLTAGTSHSLFELPLLLLLPLLLAAAACACMHTCAPAPALIALQMFAVGAASLPARGMGAIPQQVAASLPPGTVQLNTRVAGLTLPKNGEPPKLALKGGTKVICNAAVIATDGDEAWSLLSKAGRNLDGYTQKPNPPRKR